MSRVVAYIQYGALVLILVGSALLVNPFFTTDIFEFPKLLVLIGSVGVLSISSLIDMLMRGFSRFREMPMELFPLFALFLTNLIAYLFSTDRKLSLMGEEYRFQGFITQINYLLFALNVYYFFYRNPLGGISRELSLVGPGRMLHWLMVGLFASCVLALLPFLFPLYLFEPAFFYNRVFGTFGNPNYLATFIITLLPILVIMYLPRHRFFVTFLILVLITLFLTGSRSAWIASIVGFLAWSVLEAIREKKFRPFISILTVIVLAGSLMTIQWIKPSSTLERFSLQKEQLTSLQTRFSLWEAGLKLFMQKPFTGFGQDALKGRIEPYLPERLKANDVFYIDRTHSEFVDVLVTQGIFGFLSYIAFFLMVLWRGFINKKTLAVSIALFTLILFHSVNFSTVTSNILLYFLAGYILAAPRDMLENKFS